MARSLLGLQLTHDTEAGRVIVALTEVEAYNGADDPASHAWRGRTPRNAVMFGPPGHLYVYFSYGLHWCANVVCGPPGLASAVLLRAGRVVEGLDLARVRRGSGIADSALARGPACLTRALGVDGRQDGLDLGSGGPLALRAGDPVSVVAAAGPRVGVSRAVDRPWRFWVPGDQTVTAYKRSPRAGPDPQ